VLPATPASRDAGASVGSSPPPGSVAAPIGTSAAAWTSIRWRKLSSRDPLGALRQVVRWRGGYVALGLDADDGQHAHTPVWTSTNGARWKLVAPSVFGMDTIVADIVAVPGGLVAISVGDGTNDCAPDPGCWTLGAPVRSWTSADGRNWTAHAGPSWTLPTDGTMIELPHLATASGVVLAMVSLGSTKTLLASSSDGTSWSGIPSSALPAHVVLDDLGVHRTFLAAATYEKTPELPQARALRTSDGRHWSQSALRSGMVEEGVDVGFARSILRGSGGVIVVGGYPATPSGPLWWQSADGIKWKRLTGYPPVGVWNGEGEGSGIVPDGDITADGQRFIALRSDARVAWLSTDGRTWGRLSTSGTPPHEGWYGEDFVLLPRGVVVRVDNAAWYGEGVTG
jgi:hypothetical protein